MTDLQRAFSLVYKLTGNAHPIKEMQTVIDLITEIRLEERERYELEIDPYLQGLIVEINDLKASVTGGKK